MKGRHSEEVWQLANDIAQTANYKNFRHLPANLKGKCMAMAVGMIKRKNKRKDNGR